MQLISEYIRKYQRVTIISDCMSEYACNIIFQNIKEVLDEKHRIKNEHRFYDIPSVEFHILDEEETICEWDAIPFHAIVNNFLSKVKPDDIFLFRGLYKESLTKNGSIPNGSIPLKIQYQSDIIIQIVNNTLSVIKDRNGNPEKHQNIDIKPFLLSYKLDKIMKRINKPPVKTI